MAQFVTRIDDTLASAVDELIAAGVVENRSAAVRLGLERLVDRHRRDAVAHHIRQGYQRSPQTESETGWLDEGTRRMIADEPW